MFNKIKNYKIIIIKKRNQNRGNPFIINKKKTIKIITGK